MTSRTLRLQDGHLMPRLGFGTWKIPDVDVAEKVEIAIGAGYRAVDTAAAYGNEAGVGRAIRSSHVPREELFVTTKLWNDSHAFDRALRAFDQSQRQLGLDTVDLYLIHWPAPGHGNFVEAWKALIRIQEEGRATSIGVSNFQKRHLQEIMDATGVVPVVNQIEVHPFLQQEELRRFHEAHGITTESWSPLAKGGILDHPLLVEISRKHGKTVAQVVLRWHLENGLVLIPKSVTPSRIAENIDVFDFHLGQEDLRQIATLDEGRRVGPNPDTFA